MQVFTFNCWLSGLTCKYKIVLFIRLFETQGTCNFPENFSPTGMFNISDKILVSLEIMIEWRHLFRRGVPISTAIESKLAAMTEKVQVCLHLWMWDPIPVLVLWILRVFLWTWIPKEWGILTIRIPKVWGCPDFRFPVETERSISDRIGLYVRVAFMNFRRNMKTFRWWLDFFSLEMPKVCKIITWKKNPWVPYINLFKQMLKSTISVQFKRLTYCYSGLSLRFQVAW